MASKRLISREKRIASMSNLKIRDELRGIIKNKSSDPVEIMEAVQKLTKRPVDESPCRHRRRCVQCGRPRGVYRKFQLCRACIRDGFFKKYFPGWVCASW
ncbi:MAG TPA: 30S ribosomal protein S14 [Gammaproteobacteria bacterium]|nr:30S ribosomal protein S14 [Gammaproteobacteria bacterium]